MTAVDSVFSATGVIVPLTRGITSRMAEPLGENFAKFASTNGKWERRFILAQ